jgi:hypothetical protein
MKEEEARMKEEEARIKEEEARIKREEEAAKAKWPWRLVAPWAGNPGGPTNLVTFYQSKADCEKAARQYEAAQCERRP